MARAIKSFIDRRLKILDTLESEGAISDRERVKASSSPLRRGVEGSRPHPQFLCHRGRLIYRVESSTSTFPGIWRLFGGAWGRSECEHTLEEEGGHISFWPLKQLIPRCVRVY